MSHEIHTIGVTGATGGIGSEIFKKTSQHPDLYFVAFGRDSVKLRVLGAEEERIYNLDDSLDTLRRSLTGIDSMIHLAGLTNEKNDREAHDKANRLATENLATVAAEYGIPFIYTGSTAQNTDTPTIDGTITNKTIPFSNAAYGGSKVEAHMAAQRLATEDTKERGYKPIQIVPGMTIGPDTAWIDFMTKGGFRVGVMERFMRGTEIGWSNMDDVTDLLINIATNPYVATADRYLAVNGMANTDELFSFFADLRGEKLSKALPKGLIEPIGKVLLRALGKNAPVSPEAFSFGLHGHAKRFDSQATKDDYGWEPKTLEQTFSDIRQSFRQQK